MPIWRIFRAKVAGHLPYFGVSFNTVAKAVFDHASRYRASTTAFPS